MSPGWRRTGEEPPGPRRVGESLDRLSRGLGLPPATATARLVQAWPDVVGEAVAAHTSPRWVRDGVLSLAVDDPVWAAQLRWLETDLLARVAEVTGPDVVREIRLHVRR
jgi:predicted nucleic acid-binding Zn ribbon protein